MSPGFGRAETHELELVSIAPGRLRWRTRPFPGDEARASAISECLRRTAGVLSSKVNPLTGSILVLHDGSLRQAEAAAEIASIPTSAPPAVPGAPRSTDAPQDWKRDVFVGTTLAGAAAAASLLRIVAIGAAVDGLIRSGGRGILGVRPWTVLTIGASTWVYLECRRHSVLAFRRAGLKVSRDATVAGLEAVLSADMGSIEAWSAASGANAMINDVGDLERAFDGAGELVLVAANTALLTSAFVLLAPRFSWIPVAVVGTMAVFLIGGAAAQEDQAEPEPRSVAQSRILEVFEALPTVRSYGLEKEMVARVEDVLAGAMQSGSAKAVAEQRDPLRLEGIAMVGAAVTIVVAATSLAAGTMSPGRHLVLMMIAGHMFYPFAYMSVPIANARRGLSARKHLQRLSRMPSESDPPAPAAVPDEAYGVGFRNVSFSYPGSSAPALSAVDFEIPAGSFAAIVGASGSGKSTLTRLLLRFYEPDDGAVLLNGRDVRLFARRDVRRSIAWADQRSFLFDETIAYNISLAQAGADGDEMEEAARLATVDQFASADAGGLDAGIGARGTRLSDGQRQRVLLARALMKRSPLVLLDEATSALDADTERRVLANMRESTRDRTLVVIAHHLESIEDADLIIVMEEGSVVGTGTHADLVSSSPAYRRLLSREVEAVGPS
jgi:ABC-type multidrug transport system fused ATPase/permease subunit